MHGGWWVGAVWFFGPVPKSDRDAIGVWRMEKWQRLTMGPQREMVNGVLLVFSFSDRELTVFLPSSGTEFNSTFVNSCFDRCAPRSAWSSFVPVGVSFAWGLALCCRTLRECLVIITITVTITITITTMTTTTTMTITTGDERGETATLDPGRATEPPWVARTRMMSARLRGARRGSHVYSRVPQVPPGTGGLEADDGSQEEVRLKVFHQKEK